MTFMSCCQASGDHGAAHLGGRKKLFVPVASPALPPDSETFVPPTPGRMPQPSAAAIRLARQAMGSAGKRAGLPVQLSSHPSWHPPSVYDSKQGPASAAVAAVASAPGAGTLLYSTSSPRPQSVVAEDSFGVQLSPPRNTDDELSELEMAEDFLAFNVIMSPAVAEESGDYSAPEGTGTSAGGSSDVAVLSDPVASQINVDTKGTEAQPSAVLKPRRRGRFGRTRRARPQSAPAAPNGSRAAALCAWDDVESSRPSLEVSGLQVGVSR